MSTKLTTNGRFEFFDELSAEQQQEFTESVKQFHKELADISFEEHFSENLSEEEKKQMSREDKLEFVLDSDIDVYMSGLADTFEESFPEQAEELEYDQDEMGEQAKELVEHLGIDF